MVINSSGMPVRDAARNDGYPFAWAILHIKSAIAVQPRGKLGIGLHAGRVGDPIGQMAISKFGFLPMTSSIRWQVMGTMFMNIAS